MKIQMKLQLTAVLSLAVLAQAGCNFLSPEKALSTAPAPFKRVTFNGPIVGAFSGEQGRVQVVANQPVDAKSFFFQALGTNPRTCVTCHQPDHGFTIAAGAGGFGATVPGTGTTQERYALNPSDPIFLGNDGSNCEGVTSVRSSFSMLLNLGLIRVAVPMPANAEFTLVSVDDPLGCAPSTDNKLSFYRRPLPTANLPYVTSVMWDGRESSPGMNLRAALTHQAMDAVLGHAQGSASPTDAQLKDIVDFELGLFTALSTLDIGAADPHAQSFVSFIGPAAGAPSSLLCLNPSQPDPFGICPGSRRIIPGALDATVGANGGPVALMNSSGRASATDSSFRLFGSWLVSPSSQAEFDAVKCVSAGNPAGCCDPAVLTTSAAQSACVLQHWAMDAQPPAGTGGKDSVTPTPKALAAARKLVAFGEFLFETRTFTAANVPGLEALPNIGFNPTTKSAVVRCASCHDSPIAKNNLEDVFMDIGVSGKAGDLISRTPASGYLPLPQYTLSCHPAGGATTTVTTTDVGRAMVTGKCEDIGKMKVPVLRGVAARSPYFHNGFSNKERDVIEFYNQRFGIGLSNEEKEALTAFIQAL